MAENPSGENAGDGLRAMLRDAGCSEELAGSVAQSLDWPVDCGAERWAGAVLNSAAPVLEERARRVWRRQMSGIMVAAMTTLPLWLVAGAYTIGLVYEALCGVVPTAVATYVVSTYAVIGLGVVGATYALIPVVIGRSRDRMAFARTWEVAR